MALKRGMEAAAKVVVRTVPSGAEVLVDGEVVGTTPAVLTIALPREVTFRLEGYASAREVITEAGELTIKLTRKSGRPPAGRKDRSTRRSSSATSPSRSSRR